MQLIDRYLYAIGRYLPRERRDDILAELRANILERAEDREQELGRVLTLDEEEEILREHGHPMQVAARYLPQQYLIGPNVFPFYWYTLRVAFPWVLLLYVIAQCTQFITQAVTVPKLVEIAFGFVPTLFYFGAIVTLVFAAMEFGTSRYVKNTKVLFTWKPRKLPEIEAEAPAERYPNPIYDFIGSIVTLVFLVVIRQHPMWILGPAAYYAHVAVPAPIWLRVYDMAMVFVSIQLALKGMVIFSPNARGWRIATKLVTKASAIAIIGFLMGTREYVVAAIGSPADIVKAITAINEAMRLGWNVVIVILVLQLLWEIATLFFPRLRLRPQLPHSFLVK
jgi:hypothetical protein